jgi:hypothetical protein
MLLFIATMADFGLGLALVLRGNSFTAARLRFTTFEFSGGHPVPIAGLGLLHDGCPTGGTIHSVQSQPNVTLAVDLGAPIHANGWWYLPAAVDSGQPVPISSWE